jgi:hypothetical protein
MHPSRMDVAIMEENAMCDLGSFVHCPGPRHSTSMEVPTLLYSAGLFIYLKLRSARRINPLLPSKSGDKIPCL